MQTEKFSGRLKSFDAIRGIGAFWVMAYHITHVRPGPVGLRYFILLPIDYAALALLLFILISGFCIHGTAAKKISGTVIPKLSWPKFWKRRVHRLYPPYVLAVVFSLLMREVTSSSLHVRHVAFFPDLAAHLVMIHNLIPQFIPGVGNPPLWSLALEEQLYGLYAVLMGIRRRISIQTTVLVVFLIGLAWVSVFSLLTGESPDREARWWYFWPFTFWFAWALGAFAAEIYSGAVKPRSIYFSLPFSALLFLFAVMTSGPILGLFIRTNFFVAHGGTDSMIVVCRLFINVSNFFFAASFFILLNFLASAERRGTLIKIPRFLSWFGLMSYSFYLTHEPVVRFIESYVGTDTAVLAILLRYLLIVPVCVGVSWVYFQLVEKRFLNTRNAEIIKGNAVVGAGSGKG